MFNEFGLNERLLKALEKLALTEPTPVQSAMLPVALGGKDTDRLLSALRRFGLQATPLATARCDTIRLRLLKIGAQVRITVRRVWFALAENSPFQAVFIQVWENLRAWTGAWGLLLWR